MCCGVFQFGGSEAIITALSDEFPVLRQHRELFVLALFVLYFFVGLASCAEVLPQWPHLKHELILSHSDACVHSLRHEKGSRFGHRIAYLVKELLKPVYSEASAST